MEVDLVVDVQKVFSILHHSTGDWPYPSRVGRHSKAQRGCEGPNT